MRESLEGTAALRELSPELSPISSEEESAATDAARQLEELVSLLQRPRATYSASTSSASASSASGGFGGHISFSEFCVLARSLGWGREDAEDCWYDILMGVPAREATDMQRVADLVCAYCHISGTIPRLSPSLRAMCEASTAPPLPMTTREPSSSVPPPPQGEQGDMQHDSIHKKEGHFARDAPQHTRAPSKTAPQGEAAAAAHSTEKAEVLKRFSVDTLSSARRNRHTDVSTMEHQLTRRQTPHRRTVGADGDVAHRGASPVHGTVKKSSRKSEDEVEGVFTRLHKHAAKVRGNTKTQTSGFTRPVHQSHAEREAACCTFKPSITPYPLSARSTNTAQQKRAVPAQTPPPSARSQPPDTGDDLKTKETRTSSTPTRQARSSGSNTTPSPKAHKQRYTRATQSYYAKLISTPGSESGAHKRDPLEQCPETPRVTFNPPPGPSSAVPAGYVEEVARRRRFMAARETGSFEATLRGTSTQAEEAEREALLSKPILRLPLHGGAGTPQRRGRASGTRDSVVDVRLASPHRQIPDVSSSLARMPLGSLAPAVAATSTASGATSSETMSYRALHEQEVALARSAVRTKLHPPLV